MSAVLADALEHLVRGIVDHPDEVRVDLVTTRRGRTLEVRVHPEDLGKVIGRGGRTATALRTVVGGIGGRGVRVDVEDGRVQGVRGDTDYPPTRGFICPKGAALKGLHHDPVGRHPTVEPQPEYPVVQIPPLSSPFVPV